MLALFRRNTPPPPVPAKKRLSRHKVRRFASLSLASLVLCLIAFRSLRTQSAVASAALEEAAHSVSEGSLLNISDGHTTRRDLHAQSQSDKRLPNSDKEHALGTFARNANLSARSMDRAGAGARMERVTAHSAREDVTRKKSLYVANAREMHTGTAVEGYHAGKDMATEGKEGVDHLERFYHRDFVEEFGIPVTNSCVVTANTRASLKRHSIKDDAFYKYLKRSGKLELYQIRYAEVIDGGSGGLLPNSKGAPLHENLYYVKRTRQGRMGFGLFAAEDIPNGTILGEYGGKYTPCDKVENPEYLWDLPMFSIQGADGKWRNEQWGIDAMEMGNGLRFCNDLGPETWNVITRYVPWNGLWHVIYETTTDVRRGEEFSISYGKAYWSRRHQLLKHKTS